MSWVRQSGGASKRMSTRGRTAAASARALVASRVAEWGVYYETEQRRCKCSRRTTLNTRPQTSCVAPLRLSTTLEVQKPCAATFTVCISAYRWSLSALSSQMREPGAPSRSSSGSLRPEAAAARSCMNLSTSSTLVGMRACRLDGGDIGTPFGQPPEPLQPLDGIHAARALLLDPASHPEQAGRPLG